MADTEYSALAGTTTIAPTDSILIVRAGVPYRFTGTLPAIGAGGEVGIGTASPQAKMHVADGSIIAGDSGVVLLGRNGASFPTGSGKGYFRLRANNSTADTGGLSVDFLNAGAYYEGLLLDGSGNLLTGTDNQQTLGGAAKRWSVVYAGTGVINTSDEREKRDIAAIPDAWLDAWGDVEWCRFKFKAGDRWHAGLVAQRVHAAFEARGLDAFEIGLCCFDAWEAAPARRAVEEKRNKAGEVVRSAEPAVPPVPGGDRWGLRYEECFAIEAAWQRRELARLGARLAAAKL